MKSIINFKKLDKKYSDKQFLDEKDFNNFHSIKLSTSADFNKNFYNNFNEDIAGVVIKSGFWKGRFLWSPKRFINSISKRKNASWINKRSFAKKTFSKRKRRKIFFQILNKQSAFILAAAGSGKTENIVLPTILANAVSPAKSTMIITDPKGEAYRKTFNLLKENDYNIFAINTIDPKQSDSFNPFRNLKNILFEVFKFEENVNDSLIQIREMKMGLINRAESEIQKIISSIISSSAAELSVGNQKFWDSIGKDTLNFMIWLLIDDLEVRFRNAKKNIYLMLNNKKENKKDFEFNDIYNKLNINNSKIISNELNRELFERVFVKLNFQSLKSTISSVSKNWIKSFYYENFNIDLDKEEQLSSFSNQHRGTINWNSIFGSSEILQSATTTIATAINLIFSSPALAETTTFNTFNLEDLINPNKPIALFIISDNNNDSISQYVSWLINYVLSFLSSQALSLVNGKLEKPVVLILEEIGNIPKINSLANVINEGRGKNIFAYPVFQTYHQYWEKYERNDVGYFESTNTWIILTNKELEFANKVAKYFGKYEVTQDNKNIRVNRIESNDLSQIKPYEAILGFLHPNIPYKSQFVPFWMFNDNAIKRIEINNKDPLIDKIGSYLNAIYSPTNKRSISNVFDWIKWIKNKEYIIDFNEIMNLSKVISEDKKKAWELTKIYDKNIQIVDLEIGKSQFNNLDIFNIYNISKDSIFDAKNKLRDIYSNFDFSEFQNDDSLTEKVEMDKDLDNKIIDKAMQTRMENEIKKINNTHIPKEANNILQRPAWFAFLENIDFKREYAAYIVSANKTNIALIENRMIKENNYFALNNKTLEYTYLILFALESTQNHLFNFFFEAKNNYDNLLSDKNITQEEYDAFMWKMDTIKAAISKKNFITTKREWWDLNKPGHNIFISWLNDYGRLKNLDSIGNVFLSFESDVNSNKDNINIEFDKAKNLASKWSNAKVHFCNFAFLFFLEILERSEEEIKNVFDGASLILKKANFKAKWFFEKLDFEEIKNDILNIIKDKNRKE